MTSCYRLEGMAADDALATAANRYLEMLAVRGLSVHTLRSYAFAVARFLRWFAPQSLAFAALQQTDLVGYIAELRADGAKPRSINQRLAVVRSMYRFVTGQAMPRSSGVHPPAPGRRGGRYDRRLGLHWIRQQESNNLHVKTPQTLIEPLTADQVAALLKTLHRHRDRALAYMMLLCGLRSMEVLGLRINDVDAVDRSLRVCGKGNKQRLVPMPALLEKLLADYLSLERPRGCASDRLFVILQGKRRGKPMTPAGLRSLFRARRRKPGLSNANPHRLRHTFGADMARAGMSLPALQRLLGHAYPETTMCYVRLSMRDINEEYRQAIDTLARKDPP